LTVFFLKIAKLIKSTGNSNYHITAEECATSAEIEIMLYTGTYCQKIYAFCIILFKLYRKEKNGL